MATWKAADASVVSTINVLNATSLIPIIDSVSGAQQQISGASLLGDDTVITLTFGTAGVMTYTPTARTGSAAAYLTFNAPADLAIPASTEAIGINVVGAVRTWATGALTLQRSIVLGSNTIAFAGASTVTTAINVDIPAPTAGTNATITNRWGARIAGLIVNQPGGVAGTDEVQISHDGTNATVESKDGAVILKAATSKVALGSTATLSIDYSEANVFKVKDSGGSNNARLRAAICYLGSVTINDAAVVVNTTSSQLQISSSWQFAFSSGSSPETAGTDTGLSRSAAAQVGFTNGSTTATYVVIGQNTGSDGLIKAPNAASGAGNNLYYTGSSAGSGNTNGGSHIFVPGAKAGSGVDGTIIFRAATASPGANIVAYQISSGATQLAVNAAGELTFYEATGVTPLGRFVPNSGTGQVAYVVSSGGYLGLAIRGATSRSQPLLQLQTSASASLGNVGGCVFDHIADASSTSTDGTFDTIYTDTTVANALAINGDKITFDYSLTVVSSATATRQFKLAFAGITIFDSGALTFAATGTVRIFGYIVRKTSTTCRAMISFRPAGSSTILGFAQEVYVADGTLTGLTLTGTNVLLLTAAAASTGAASGDIKGVTGTVSIIPAGT